MVGCFAQPAGISSRMLALFSLQGPVLQLTYKCTADSYSTHLYTLVVKISDPLTLADSTLCSLLQWKESASYNEARMECLGNKTAGIWPESISLSVRACVDVCVRARVWVCVCVWAKKSSKCMFDQGGRVPGTCTLITDNFVTAVTRLQPFGRSDLIRPDLKAGFKKRKKVARPNYSAFVLFFFFDCHLLL